MEKVRLSDRIKDWQILCVEKDTGEKQARFITNLTIQEAIARVNLLNSPSSNISYVVIDLKSL